MIDRIYALLILLLVLGAPVGVALSLTGDVLLDFVFFYPLFMSALWITGGCYFWLHWERHWPWSNHGDVLPPELAGTPLISILVPCFNEGEHALETIGAALARPWRSAIRRLK